MSTEYTVEMLDFRITNLHITANTDLVSVSECTGEFKGFIREPSDPLDPTVLAQIQAHFYSASKEFGITCIAESIYRFSPIPSDWKQEVSSQCMPSFRDKVVDSIQIILKTMGHSVRIQKAK